MERKPVEKPDISEKGRSPEGAPLSSERRLYMQLLAFTNVNDVRQLTASLDDSSLTHVLYEDLNDPRGVALLSISEKPADFMDALRPSLNRGPFAQLTPRPEFTMFGRTYSLGYEPDLEETLFHRPTRTALNETWPWAIWYPLRRSGSFMKVPAEEQRRILMEHGTIGRSFGEADFAHDVRLACQGLDKHDNDFVIGLMGKELYPLSAIVQAMRKTEQTALYLDQLGPFFVGRACWRHQPQA